MSLTIGETIQQLHSALREYIEATYHISNRNLIEQRKELLNRIGVIHQEPFIESTPKYALGNKFQQMGLDRATLDIFLKLSEPAANIQRVLFNPPYAHQEQAIRLTLLNRKSIVVMTGTGSGKTECFLLPILGKLAHEASLSGKQFGETPAVRAIVLYPMNALVNDQLGRLRLLFGDKRVVTSFEGLSGRPVRFARYTSRTLYPGVRDAKRDQVRLKPIEDFYVKNLQDQETAASERHEEADNLIKQLKQRGKWPSKPDIVDWYGAKSSRWRDTKTGEYNRCVTLLHDSELITRHEVHVAPPDVLVTNYSMLEYMLMRPLERPIFDQTSIWLKNNPDERLLLVIDEAHLYRGSAGAEVGLLIRRLRTRLGISPERLQVICTSASFKDHDYALEFGAQLTGKGVADFEKVIGQYQYGENEITGSIEDINALNSLNIQELYDNPSPQRRLELVSTFLKYRNTHVDQNYSTSLHRALVDFGPMKKLINATMGQALPVQDLGKVLFDSDSLQATRATSNLVALGSIAKADSTSSSLLPCRVHSFYRGLVGLWACLDPQCNQTKQVTASVTGKLYSQPRTYCECGSRVHELFTCRHCGTAYVRTYTDNLERPDFLWTDPGFEFRTQSGSYQELEPLDLLLEKPDTSASEAIPVHYDLRTGRLNPAELGDHTRQLFRKRLEAFVPTRERSAPERGRGEFKPCAVCNKAAGYNRSSVQDHQTKGDPPFLALIAKQIQVQPPNSTASKFAPLQGRKVLIFSDSRQIAARLAPSLQKYSTLDAMRPLIVYGYNLLKEKVSNSKLLSLEDLFLAVLLAARKFRARLRPELKSTESFQDEASLENWFIENGPDSSYHDLITIFRSSQPPESLMKSIIETISHPFYGLDSLALASVIERSEFTKALQTLPDLPLAATTPEQKIAFARIWLQCWDDTGFWLSRMPEAWKEREIRTHTGNFSKINRLLSDKNTRKVFEKEWLGKLLQLFAQRESSGKFRLLGRNLSLDTSGAWAYCQTCRSTQRILPGSTKCLQCNQGSALEIDPDSDPVFAARKSYYRKSTVAALSDSPPMTLIAAEHTAQLNTAQANEVFSKAEENELLFQDVSLGIGTDGRLRPAIDILSCTTTMEVGIDIGALTGVSLRNMPPARSNYQQRAGRAGRRGNAIATVTAFGSSDSHDDHYFSNPKEMISGAVEDPILTLDNPEIARRHVIAFLLQKYHHERLPVVLPQDQPRSLFEVLGTISDFKTTTSLLNRHDLEVWMTSNQVRLTNDIDSWLPTELDSKDRENLLKGIINDTLKRIDDALILEGDASPKASEDTSQDVSEDVEEVGDERPRRSGPPKNLLDLLLYKGVLPRYAFPTDVAAFHVFDKLASTSFRPVFQYTPAQGLSAALTQYAPGKQVWVDGKLWTSGAIYSPVKSEKGKSWDERRLYYECSICHYALTKSQIEGTVGERLNCEACGGNDTLGPGTFWFRPPGFAHPINVPEDTTPDDNPPKSYATRAKLMADTPPTSSNWMQLNDRVMVYFSRQHLLVTNRGPQDKGYNYCKGCGLIEPSMVQTSEVYSEHQKPYVDEKEPTCTKGGKERGLVLGTDFITDVLLISLKVENPLSLRAGYLATEVALRTLCEAVTKAACVKLELEERELQAEFRPALTQLGRDGKSAELYIYDTLPGGAGFSQQVGRQAEQVFIKALNILESCKESCDSSCYRCLRSYKNKFEHKFLDRHLGASLLRYLLYGEPMTISVDRVEQSTEILFDDLKRAKLRGIEIFRNRKVVLQDSVEIIAPILVQGAIGGEIVIGLHSPLAVTEPVNTTLKGVKNNPSLLLIDELVIRKSLPAAIIQVLERIKPSN